MGAPPLNAGHSNPAQARLGRFLSRDPIGFAGGLNLYNYCINNPVNYVDPSGLVLRIGYDSSTDAGFELLGLLNRYSNLNIKLNPVQEYIARKNGEIEITPEMLGKPGANENELAKQIRAAAASSKGINFDAVSNEPTCFGGLMESTQRQVIDVYDFRQIVRDFPPEIVGGWLTHELTEGFTAQTSNIGYDEGAHKAGLDAENRYLAPFGWRRESDYRRLPYANFERTLPDGSTQKFHMTNAPDALGGTDFQWNPGWLSSP